MEKVTLTNGSAKEAVLTAVTRDGLALKHASEELKHDSDVVLATVRQNGLAL